MEMSTGRGKAEELNTSFPVSGRKGGTTLIAWSEEGPVMPLASNELEISQVRKLIQCTRQQDKPQILKLLEGGIPNLVNYQGRQALCWLQSSFFQWMLLSLVWLFISRHSNTCNYCLILLLLGVEHGLMCMCVLYY